MTTEIINNTISQPKSRELVSKIIPILIRWAKNGIVDHTYNDIIKELGYAKFSGIGKQLGYVDDVMRELGKQTRENIPTLNALCKNSQTGLPSKGFSYVYTTYDSMSKEEKLIFVAGLNEKAINYGRWDWVLDSLGLEEAKAFTEEEVAHIKSTSHSYGIGGEGEQHKALKEYIFNQPSAIKIKNPEFKQTEYSLPSGDRLDVYFETRDNRHIAVEVKSSISSDDDIVRGIFQCVKYKAILKALRQVEAGSYCIDAILVTERAFNSEQTKLAKELGISYIENFKK